MKSGIAPTRKKNRIRPNEKVPIELNDRERELILKHTFAGDELTGRLRIVRKQGESQAVGFTLDDLDELAGYVVAEANHAKNKKLQKELHQLYALRPGGSREAMDLDDPAADPQRLRALKLMRALVMDP